MRIRRFRAVLAVMLGAACSDPAGPGTEGPLGFSARLDGSPWTANAPATAEAHLTAEGYFQVRAFRRDSLFRAIDGIAVVVRHVQGSGRYPLTSDFDRDYGIYGAFDPINLTDTTFLSTPTTGELEITQIDTVARRIAGRFSFEAEQIDGTRRVRIEAGVFRVVYDSTFP
jgi:hypothetical protein